MKCKNAFKLTLKFTIKFTIKLVTARQRSIWKVTPSTPINKQLLRYARELTTVYIGKSEFFYKKFTRMKEMVYNLHGYNKDKN